MKYYSKTRNTACIVLIFAFLVSFVLPHRSAFAKTEIVVIAPQCTIYVILHKEFYLTDYKDLSAEIEAVREKLAGLEKFMDQIIKNPVLIGITKGLISLIKNRTQRLIDECKRLLKELEDNQRELEAEGSLKKSDLEKKAEDWKKAIEDTWNAANYVYDCCQVKFIVEVKVRDKKSHPTPGFDQIGVVPAGSGYRDRIRGFGPFDDDGFSNDPYEKDLGGEWNSGSDRGVAAHEAGHEMGLDDQYDESFDENGELVSTTRKGHEHDIMDGREGRPVNSIDNIKTILKKRAIKCPPECCKEPKTPVPHDKTGKDTGLVEDRPKDFEVWDQPVRLKDEVVDREYKIEDRSRESIQYKTVKKDKMSCDVGVLYREMPDGGMEVDVSMLATGIGASTIWWEIDKVRMNVDGVKINPSKTKKFYTDRTYAPSSNVAVATAVFTAIGSQYTRYADQAQSGGVCPVTGEKLPPTSRKVSPATEAIDRAGMAAGLGLLASQAGGGSIKGHTATFKLDRGAAEKVRNGETKLEIEANNTRKPQSEKIEIPIGK